MSSAVEPEPGATGSVDLIVSERDLASILVGGAKDPYPPVLATARMIALMEVASSRILRPLLGSDEMSVGVHVDVSHTAATPEGARVTATARYRGREGKIFVFEVAARDAGGEIGRGVHKRAIVRTDRLVSGAQRRNAPG
jgi:fluoroacetyl-CoA thioesterase